MELVFKSVLEITPDDPEVIDALGPIQQEQFVLAVKVIYGYEVDLDEGYLERYESEFEESLEFGMKFLHVFNAGNDPEPVYDMWSNNIDAVLVLHHDTTTEAGALRIQGGFEPQDRNNADDVALAKALDAANHRAAMADKP